MKTTTAFAAAVVALTMGAAQANAAAVSGTGSVAMLGVTSSTPTIGAGTSFSNAVSLFAGGLDDFLPIAPNTAVTVAAVTATAGSLVSFSAAFGSYSGAVAAGGVKVDTLNNGVIVSVNTVGNFTPAGTLSGFQPNSMSAIFSFTQTGGPNTSVSGSFTFAAPAAPPGPPIPEPMSLALFGIGLAGLGVAARRRS